METKSVSSPVLQLQLTPKAQSVRRHHPRPVIHSSPHSTLLCLKNTILNEKDTKAEFLRCCNVCESFTEHLSVRRYVSCLIWAAQ